MNHIYRLIWNQATRAWVVASEIARSQGKRSSGMVLAASLVSAPAFAVDRNALPSGGAVSSGQASIGQHGSALTIKQQSQNVAINWQDFNIGSNAAVKFVQPNSSAIALNRVLGANGTQILGQLNANGQVWVLNPNGVLFGRGAHVNVGGLAASTLGISDADFMAGKRTFTGRGGSVANQGTINADYVALLGEQVRNEGVIVARLGTVAMGAGSQVTLDFAGDKLLSMQVDRGAVRALAENKGLIQADGGAVLMSAKARDALIDTVVNNTGVIHARTLENREGKILLIGDMDSGTVKVGGTLDASAPDGGKGGFIETSAAHVKVADRVKVTTKAASGNNGTWLIDPVDFTIAASGGDMTGADVSNALANGNFIIQSTSGSKGTAGDVNVNDTVSWIVNTLTLNAQHDININAQMNASGTAGLALEYGQGAVATGNTATYNVKAPVNLAATSSFSTKLGSDGGIINYTIITEDLGLPEIKNIAGNYVLGSDMNKAYFGFSGGIGNNSAGDDSSRFTGRLDGLGHVIRDLKITSASPSDEQGLFGAIGTTGVVRNLGITGDSGVSGDNMVGILAARNYGAIENVWTRADVAGTGNYVGGLVGYNAGSIRNSWSSGYIDARNPTGVVRNYVGGLVGYNDGSIDNAWATGSVNAGTMNYVGGLVGHNNGGTLSNVGAAGQVAGNSYVGGLAGYNETGTIENAWATGNVAATTGSHPVYAGGLVGYNAHGTLVQVYATGNVESTGAAFMQSHAGGLAGYNGGDIRYAYALGDVNSSSNGGHYLGGLVGVNDGSISNAYSTGSITSEGGVITVVGQPEIIVEDHRHNGGLVGTNNGTVINSVWDKGSSGRDNGLSTNEGGNGAFFATGLDHGNAYNETGYRVLNGGNAWACSNGICTSADNNWLMFEGSTRPFLQSEYSTQIANAHQLQLMALDLGADYTLLANIDASGTDGFTYAKSMWNTSGFLMLADGAAAFTGTLDGQGYGISGLYLHAGNSAGLFGRLDGSSVVHDLQLNVDVEGGSQVGGLASYNDGGTITNVSVSGSVTGSGDQVGGLVGFNNGGAIRNATSSATTSGVDQVGGLLGYNDGGRISNGNASGNVSGRHRVGGLIGHNDGGEILTARASGDVTGSGDQVGGLVGRTDNGRIDNADAMGNVTGNDDVGGLLGINNGGALTGTRASGTVLNNGTRVGGLVGHAVGGSIGNAWASGNVSGSGPRIGGLVGWNDNGTINDAWASGTVSGGDATGGLLGENTGSMSTVAASGNVTGSGHNVGGLIGTNTGNIDNAYTTGNIDGGGYVGGLVGTNTGNITNAYTTGNIDGGDYVGGLVGANTGNITNAYTTGNIDGGDYVGGLVGDSIGSLGSVHAMGVVVGDNYVGGLLGRQTDGSVNDAYVRGEVTGTGSYTGGLLGYNDRGDITNVFADGKVTGHVQVGGLVGYNNGHIDRATAVGNTVGLDAVGALVGWNDNSIRNAYAVGNASGGNHVGGLVGVNNGGSIGNSFATGDVSGSTNVGRLVGSNAGTVSNSFWNSEASVTGATESVQPRGASGKTLEELSHADVLATLNGGNASAVWSNIDNSSTPWLLTSQRAVTYLRDDLTVASGATRPRLYDVIRRMDDLQTMGQKPSGAYVLAIDLDASGFGNFRPVDDFSGIFDGRNHTITWLSIVQDPDFAGLFSSIEADGVVRNLGLINSYVDAWNSAGTLAGVNYGTIDNVWVTAGFVNGANSVGGLVGDNYGTISNSWAAAGVQGFDNIGGLVGSNHGTISDSYARGSAFGEDSIGGLVGWNSGSIVDSHAGAGVSGRGRDNSIGGLVGENTGNVLRAYATGTVEGTESQYMGGLVGLNRGSIDNAYATGTVQGKASQYVGGLVGLNSGSIDNAWSGSYVLTKNWLIYDPDLGTTVTGRSNYTGGLVGLNDSNASITNAWATGNVEGIDSVGGLVGENRGSLSLTYATGEVIGKLTVGGLVGKNIGSIDQSFATGNVSSHIAADEWSAIPQLADNYVGGLVGWNDNGRITNAYATGNVEASNAYVSLQSALIGGNQLLEIDQPGTIFAGGLVGSHMGADGFIGNAYATGQVQGPQELGVSKTRVYEVALTGEKIRLIWESDSEAQRYLGGLVGLTIDAGFGNVYWNSDSNSVGTYTANGGSSNLGGLSLADMQKQSSFAGFDFDSTWRIYEGHTAPLLRGFMTALTITANSGSKTYDGTTDGLGASYSIMPDGSLLQGTLATAMASKDAGDNTVSSSGLYSTQFGYDIQYVAGTVHVDKANAMVTAQSSVTTYNGQAQSVSGYTVTGLVNNETASVLDSLSESGGTGTNAGSYAHTVSGSDNNYNFTFVDGSLSIGKAVLSITTGDVAKTYDGTTSANGTAIVTGGQLFGTDSIRGGSFAYADKNAGTGKTVTVSGITVDDGNNGGNYDVTYVANTNSAIGKANATVTANSDTVAYNGQTQRAAGFTASGLVAGETAGMLTGLILSGGSGTDIGRYVHTVSGTDGNYALNFVDGALTINPAGSGDGNGGSGAIPGTPALARFVAANVSALAGEDKLKVESDATAVLRVDRPECQMNLPAYLMDNCK
jgi:filamentous hemagglutinin family protein